MRKVKVEEEDDAWAGAAGAEAVLIPPDPAGPPGCPSTCKVEQPCPEELSYGVLPAWGAGPHLDSIGLAFGALNPNPSLGGCGRRSQAGPRPFCCPQCGKAFGKKAHLTRHLRVHTGERPFPCPHCGRRFRQRIHLRSHLRTHTGERPYPCPRCARRFRKKTHLDRHLRTHTGERPHPCPRCPRRFAHRQHLLRHLRLHGEPAPGHECSGGDGDGSAEEKPLPCPGCEMSLAWKQNSEPEMGMNAGEVEGGGDGHLEERRDGDADVPVEERVIICPQCGTSLSWKQNSSSAQLWQQLESQALGCAQDPLQEPRAQDPQLPSQAPTAQRPFLQDPQLLSQVPGANCTQDPQPLLQPPQTPGTQDHQHHLHVPSAKTEQGCAQDPSQTPPAQRPFTCPQCGRGFGRKAHLARHLLVHSGTRPHACARCGRRFSSKTNLGRHQAVHTGLRPHRCSRCGRSFTRKTHLERHERTHGAGSGAGTATTGTGVGTATAGTATSVTGSQLSWPQPPTLCP